MMALPACSICDSEQPMLIQGDTATGDQTFIGAQCLPMFILSAAAELTKGMPPEWCEAYGELFNQIAANDRRPPKPPAPAAKRARTGKPAAGKPESDAAGPLAVAVTLDEPCPQCQGTKATGDDDKLTCDGCGNVLAVVPAPSG